MSFPSRLFGRKPKTHGYTHESSAARVSPKTSPRETFTKRKQSSGIKWRPDSFPMNAVGESNYQAALVRICSGHNRYGHDVELPATIALEPSNPYDSNAVVVKIQGKVVGYLPREQALRVGAQMREEGLHYVSCGALIVGGWRTNQYDEGSFGVRLAIPTRGWIDFGTGVKPPEKPRAGSQSASAKSKRPEPSSSGPLVGECVAILGARSDGELAKELAAKGARNMANLGKSTTLLVIASERPFDPGTTRSVQYMKAEERIRDGEKLKIVSGSTASSSPLDIRHLLLSAKHLWFSGTIHRRMIGC